MAHRIGIRELRDTLTAQIRRVRAGETLEITHDGVPVALLTPIPDDPIQRLVRSGLARPALKPPDWSAIRRSPVTGPMTATEALEEDRGD